MMSDALHAPANPRTSGTVPGMAECPVCQVALNKKNLDKHLRKVHGGGGKPTGKSSLESVFDAGKRTEFTEAQGATRKGKVIGWSPDDNAGNKRKVKVNKKYYKCWQCGKLLTKASTANHLIKIHGIKPKDPLTAHFWYFDEVIKVQYRDKSAASPSTKKRKSKNEVDWQKEIAKLSKSKLPDGSSASIKCPVCETSLRAKNVKKHFKKVHRELFQTQKPTNSVSSAEDQSVSAKKKILDIRPDYEYSEDVFDRAKVYQGGAYGLGKSRKH